MEKQKFNKLYDRVLKDVESFIKSTNFNLNKIEYIAFYGDKSTRRLAFCKASSSLHFNNNFIENGTHDDIKNVIAHEIFHCVKESKGHDRIWKYLISSFNKEKGYNIQQYSNNIIACNTALKYSFKYVFNCDSCENVFTYNKNCRTVRLIKMGMAKCKCGGGIIFDEK